MALPLAAVLVACTNDAPAPEEPPQETAAAVTEQVLEYVGSDACTACHAKQAAEWDESQHFLAMQPATEATVTGDFNDAAFSYAGVEHRMFVEEGGYFMRADGADGEPADFAITHTFGVDPLQQYLVSFDDGRRQALSVSWDVRPAAQGGQRWFHLYPDEELTHTDSLHWTGRNQNWNYMCADCHSTNFEKGYDASTQSYDSTWSEISVGCEACHGPGSAHVEEALSGAYSKPRLTASLEGQKAQIEICARCHSRRGILAEGFEPGTDFLEHYRLSLLDEGLYHADGQVLDEVYVYGSFLQSKMYQRGVRCTDCHNPHTATLEASDNATCTRCHQENPPPQFPTLAAKVYDSPEHHFHEADTDGAQCVNCHMPSKYYMVVDERHDHSFRIPRPDLTQTLGVPNACNACHTDKDAAWAAAEIAARTEAPPAPHYGEVLAAGRLRDPSAPDQLAALAADTTRPPIVRGTALSLLAGATTQSSATALLRAVRDDEALVRFGALAGMAAIEPAQAWQMARHLLSDPVRAVRLEAAAYFAPLLRQGLSEADRAPLTAALREYIEAQQLNADRPEALTNLGGVYVAVGEPASAETAYRQALVLDAGWVPALVNLADLYRGVGRDGEAAALLQESIARLPDAGDLRHAYGLTLVRQGREDAALAELAAASRLSPGNARYLYVHAVALNSSGRDADAVTVLEDGLERFPGDPELLLALTTFQRDRGNVAEALNYARQLAALRPGDPELARLVQELERAVR
ncbi:MAG: cytochrome c3 family protein [Pseudomonadota bacterium]